MNLSPLSTTTCLLVAGLSQETATSTEVLPPLDLVPKEMLEVRLKEFRQGRLYCLSFRKPGREHDAGS